MAQPITKPKYKFPGMSPERFKQFHERLMQADEALKLSNKAQTFRNAAARILPGWERRS